ncbi:MAG TPA: ribosome maturation factor RimM, partial [Candidatus Eremiobacteraceae bacterium]|nr:ribosome maturation factor RimM [Candidatus Eremiobacteraceae bacterium]
MTPDPALVSLGRIAGAFGLRGDVKVQSNEPNEFVAGLRLVARTPSGAEREMVVEAVRIHKGDALLRFRDVRDATSADALAGIVVLARRSDLSALPADTYRDSDLIGLSVFDARLGELGPVESVRHYPASDLLVVGSSLIPLLHAYEVRIDLATKRIDVTLPAG